MRDLLLLTLLIVVGIVLLQWLVPFLRRDRVIINDFERGLLYRDGQLQRLLMPGTYSIRPTTEYVQRVDLRLQTITVVGQEVLTADNISLKISLAGTYRVAEPQRALTEVASYFDSLYLLLQMEARDLIGSLEIDELLARRQEMAALLLERAAPKAAAFGLELLSAGLKDITFPGDLKRIFAQVVNARKEGLAALERARGESAALRNLANSAKLLEKNPALLQLRLLQAVGGGSNNTIVLKLPADGDVDAVATEFEGEG